MTRSLVYNKWKIKLSIKQKKNWFFFFLNPVYDITKRSSFLSLQRWIEEVRRYTSSHVVLILVGESISPYDNRKNWKKKKNVLFVSKTHLIACLFFPTGNKCDLEGLREVEKEEARAVCQCLPEILHVVETSAKENTNIDTIFYCMASELKVKKQNSRNKPKRMEKLLSYNSI